MLAGWLLTVLVKINHKKVDARNALQFHISASWLLLYPTNISSSRIVRARVCHEQIPPPSLKRERLDITFLQMFDNNKKYHVLPILSFLTRKLSIPD